MLFVVVVVIINLIIIIIVNVIVIIISSLSLSKQELSKVLKNTVWLFIVVEILKCTDIAQIEFRAFTVYVFPVPVLISIIGGHPTQWWKVGISSLIVHL